MFANDDPFETLALPPRFDLDAPSIDRAYLSAIAHSHPDLSGAQADQATQAAAANRARQTLADPERRANALLARLGGPGKEQDKSLPDGFLMDIMETREAIEAAIASGEDRSRWQAWADRQRQSYIDRVRQLFAALPAADTPPQPLRDIRRELNAWRYVERLIEQLDPGYDPREADFRT
jgi:DnaJ-domain-containing protein 1